MKDRIGDLLDQIKDLTKNLTKDQTKDLMENPIRGNQTKSHRNDLASQKSEIHHRQLSQQYWMKVF